GFVCIHNYIAAAKNECNSSLLTGVDPFTVKEAALMTPALMTQRQGHHFLQIPGPSPVPERVLRAMDRQVIDHRGPEFQQLGLAVLEGCKAIFKTSGPVVIYPSSGTGAWEAAIVNTLSPGDKV